MEKQGLRDLGAAAAGCFFACYSFGMMFSPPAELISRGFEARREKRMTDARHLFAAAVEHCRKANDRLLLAEALAGLGCIRCAHG